MKALQMIEVIIAGAKATNNKDLEIAAKWAKYETQFWNDEDIYFFSDTTEIELWIKSKRELGEITISSCEELGSNPLDEEMVDEDMIQWITSSN